MKNHANQHRRDVQFDVGDYVYLKLQPYRQTTVAFRHSMKLSPRFYGPFRISERIGQVAYRLELPPRSLIHNVFHVSQLRKHLGPVHTVIPQLPPVSETLTILPQPESIIDRRVIQKDKYRPKVEILVRWKGAQLEDATWEDERRFSRTYPNFPCGQGTLGGEK